MGWVTEHNSILDTIPRICSCLLPFPAFSLCWSLYQIQEKLSSPVLSSQCHFHQLYASECKCQKRLFRPSQKTSSAIPTGIVIFISCDFLIRLFFISSSNLLCPVITVKEQPQDKDQDCLLLLNTYANVRFPKLNI